MKINTVYYLLLILVILSCKSAHYSVENWPQTYLSFGSFGGFSGMISTTYLLPNGQVFHENSMDNKKIETNKLSKKEARNVFNSAEKINWSQLPPDNFGNMSYFFSYHTKDSTYTANWGEKGQTPPAEIDAIYQKIQHLTAHQ